MKSPAEKLLAPLIALVLATTFASMFATIFATVGAGVVCAQKPDVSPTGASVGRATRTVRTQPFERGEELIYVAEFSRTLIRKADVADFRFTAGREEPRKSNDSTSRPEPAAAGYLLKFTGDISTKGLFSKLFNLHFRERIESIVEPLSFTVQRTRRVDEQGKRSRTSESVYANGKVFWIERDPNNPSHTPRSATTAFTGQVQDVLSAIYFLRTQPLEVGKTFEVTVCDSGRVYQVPVRVFEKKRLKTVLG
ncbi:MAG: DUF3108 domain-containing protein, partial [Acidobacteriota bacterium]|nr:DUF3108 domain-containing protein [Acidobacteriota bacterium]